VSLLWKLNFKEITSAEFIEKTKGTRSKVRSTSPFMKLSNIENKRDYQGISETRNTQTKYRLCNRFIKIGTFGGTENTI
jgi:hypothetical protein